MHQLRRRDFLKVLGAGGVTAKAGTASLVLTSGLRSVLADDRNAPKVQLIEAWINRVPILRAPEEVRYIARFKDPVCFLTKTIGWKPNSEQDKKFRQVDVPAGFVTDFADLPGDFWSLLVPDSKIIPAAIIHGYMYWSQSNSRDAADQTLKSALQNGEVDPAKADGIYNAARIEGGAPWAENGRLKARGEKRILKKFPPESEMITWGEWKKRAGVFAAEE